MKTRYLAVALSLALMLEMAACGVQQAQEPQEEPKHEEVTEPVEVEEKEPEDGAVEPVSVETTPEPLSVRTEVPPQKSTETKPSEETAPAPSTSAIQQDDGEQPQTSENQTTNKEGWNQAFHETLSGT